MLEKIKKWAETQPGIRVVLLTSSRANERKKIDRLSDYDIELYVTNLKPYTDNEWLQHFGKILIVLSEKRVLLGAEQQIEMVIYEAGTKIDFTIIPMDILKKIIDLPCLPDWLNDGYKVILDKDGITDTMRQPSFKAYIPQKPTDQEYQELINEFWWELMYVAKNLARNEILPAKYSSDYVIRYKILLKMLEWYVQIKRDWEQQTGFAGKGIMKLLDEDELNQLNSIFAGAGIPKNWDALYKTISFFRKISRAVAHDLGYRYPEELDRKVSEYIAAFGSIDYTDNN